MKRNKILSVTTVIFFTFMTVYSAWNDLYSDMHHLENSKQIEDQLQHLGEVDAIIAELQKERGLTAIYNTDPTESFAALLADQHQQTSKILEQFSKALDLSDLHIKRSLIQQNTKIDHVNPSQIYTQYTQLITELIRRSKTSLFNTDNTEIKDSLIIYNLLKNAQEHASQLQTKVGVYLASETLADYNYQEILVLYTIYQHLTAKVQENQSSSVHPSLQEMKEESDAHQSFAVIQNIINRSLQNITVTPLKWFELSTSTVKYIHDIADFNANLIQTNALHTREAAKSSMIKHLLFWMGVVFTLIIIFVIAIKRSQEMLRGEHLLENYQDAIDYSTIVSKANPKGIITYVNRAFCEISGYSEEELLNRPHNIVRHSDMPKEVFQVMWDNLNTGKKWNGIVKNLRKDGTAYWVDASISPIYDEKGRLIEYIAIRRDITDMILLNEEIKDTQRELIYRMGEAVESRSKESGHHIQRVAHYSQLLAQLAGLSDEECEIIFAASTMHDIGKISTPDSILLKAGPLTEEEWMVMKTHAEIGYKILQGSNRPLLKVAATVAYEHHEHYDGNGYPRGIKGDAISIYGRIVAIADVFDALLTDRIYKKAWPIEEITAYLQAQSNRQFDPKLIALFVNNADQFVEISNRFEEKQINL